MHVLINAASANMGGAVTYLNNILKWLPVAAPKDKFTVIVPGETLAKLKKYEIPGQVILQQYPYQDTGSLQRMYFDQVGINHFVRNQNVDLVFSSTGFGTYYCNCSQVLLVRNPVYFSHDFHKKYKELGRSLRRNTLRRWLSLKSIRASEKILFPTDAMQDMVAQFIDLSDQNTLAMHYGFDHSAFNVNGVPTPDTVKKIEEWKAKGYKILLNVSTYAVHKNFEIIIEALPELIKRGHKIKLVTTTSRERTADKSEYDLLQDRARALGLDDVWHEAGYIPYSQLRSLYTVADLYVFPSFTESFGHSLVEAMASGLPIVAADMPINREVCEDAASYFPRFDTDACISAIEKVLTDDDQMKNLAAASKQRAVHFSWETYVSNLVEIFRETAS